MTAPLADKTPPPRYDQAYGRYPGGHGDIGEGWLDYSIVLLSIAGVVNCIGGIAAIGDSRFFVENTHYVLGNLSTWGWALVVIGAVQLLTAVGIYRHNQAARWVGVFALSLNAITMLLMLPAYPLWALAIFAMDIIAVYGLLAHGQRVTAQP
jgi:hypothetical protein